MDLVAQCNGYRTPSLGLRRAGSIDRGAVRQPVRPLSTSSCWDAETAADTNTPFSYAIKVRSGNIVFLSGTVGGGPPQPSARPRPSSTTSTSVRKARPKESWKNLKAMVEAAGGANSPILSRSPDSSRDIDSNQDAINVCHESLLGSRPSPGKYQRGDRPAGDRPTFHSGGRSSSGRARLR